MSRLRGLNRKIEVDHEPGLTNKQLLLTNDDLKPGENPIHASGFLVVAMQLLIFCLFSSRTGSPTMGSMELRRFLDCRFVQHQHMDDFVVDDHGWSLMVAIMAMCLVRSQPAYWNEPNF